MAQKEQQSLLIYIVLGLIIGVCLDSLFYQKVTHIYPYLWLSSFTLMFALAFDFRHPIRIFFTSAVLTAIICSPFLFMGPGSKYPENGNLLFAVLSFPYAWMIAHSFHFAYHLDNQIRIRYTSLFYAVWNTIPLLIISAIFTGIAKLLILLTAIIFSIFKFEHISEFLSSNHHFWIISTICLFITGIGIARQHLTILDSLRIVILKLFYYLYPFLAVISLVFLILYGFTAFTGQTPDTSSVIFLILGVLGIIFFNAIFQDGEVQSYQSSALWFFLKSYRIMLFIITVLAAYLFFPQSKQVANAIVLLGVLVLYGLAYGLSSILSEQSSKGWIKSTNVIIAILYLITYIIINNPFHPLFDYKPATLFGIPNPKANKESQYKKSLPLLKQLMKQQDAGLEQIGLQWKNPAPNLKTIENLCRANIKSVGWLVGTIQNDQCFITNPTHIFKESSYQILTGDPELLVWRRDGGAIAIALGVELHFNRTQSQSICRGKINDQYQVGTLSGYNCIVPYGNGVTRLFDQFDILTINSALYPQKMILLLNMQLEQKGLKFVTLPADNIFIAGTNTKGNIGICRGTYQNGVEIGSYQNNQCTISYAGKSLLLTDYTVLANTTATPNVKWRPQRYTAITQMSDSLPLGFEMINKTSIRPLEACRGIYDNDIHIGKLFDGQCHIAAGEQEKLLNNGFFTSLQPTGDR